MKIRTKLLLGILVALVFPLAGGVFSLLQLERGMRDTVGENSAAAAASLMNQIESRLYMLVDTARELAGATPEITAALSDSNRHFASLGGTDLVEAYKAEQDDAWRAWIETPERPQPAVLQSAEENPLSGLLAEKRAFWRDDFGEPIFGEIFVTNFFGANVAQTDVTSDYVQSDEEWWQAGFRDGVWLSEVGYDESSGLYGIQIAVRVDREGEPLGVLKAELNLAEVHNVLQDYEVAAALNGGAAELRNRRGALLYPEYLPPSGAALASQTTVRDSFAIEAGADGESDLLIATAQSRGHAELPDLNWTVSVRFPADIVFSPVVRLKRQALTIGLVALLLAAATAIVVSFGVSRNLRAAVGLADRIAGGDLAQDIRVGGSGEVAELRTAMHSMVGKIRNIVGGIVRTSERISKVSDDLSASGARISYSAENQSNATEVGRVSIDKMAGSIQTVSNSASRVRDEVANASASVEEMSASNETVVKNTERLAASVSENLTMVHQLASSIEQVANSAGRAGDASESAVREARDGGHAVSRAAEGAEELARTMSEIARVNRTLAGFGARINYVTEVIEGIAKKTKLLALNASVQAAHAGEHGRAFRPVTVEVKELAERSAGSAREIAALVEEVQKTIREAESISQLGADKARESAELAGSAGQALNHVVDTIEGVSRHTLEIGKTTREQASGSEYLVSTFKRMQQITDEVAEATRQQRLGGAQILQAMGRLQGITSQVGQAVANHIADGRSVRETFESMAETATRNADTVGEIVGVAEDLKGEAEALRSLGDFFVLDDSRREPTSKPPSPPSPKLSDRPSGRRLDLMTSREAAASPS